MEQNKTSHYPHIFLILILIISGLFVAGGTFEKSTQGFLILMLFLAILFALGFCGENRPLTMTYIITMDAIYKSPKFNSSILSKIETIGEGGKRLQAKLIGAGTQNYRPFNTIEGYKIKDDKIIINPKKLLGIMPFYEFTIVPNQNLNEIIAILDKFISKPA